jgi:hypothetical protein
VSATYLGIPARDLGDGLLKRMLGIARKVLMSWEEVEWFYTTSTLNACNDALREVAAASVFWAWWSGRLDEQENPEDMMTLDVLRRDIPKLDQDLHDWCERNEQEVRKKWDDKKKAKEAERNGLAATDGGGGGWDNSNNNNTADGTGAHGGGGWDTAPTTGVGAGSTWDTGNTSAPTNGGGGGWDHDNALTSTAGNIAAGGTGWDAPAPPQRAATQASLLTDPGFDSGVDVGTGATTPTSLAKSHHQQSSGEQEDGGSFQPLAPTNGVFGGFDADANGGDWADEVNQHDRQDSQGW